MSTVNTNINIFLNREEDRLNINDSYLETEFIYQIMPLVFLQMILILD